MPTTAELEVIERAGADQVWLLREPGCRIMTASIDDMCYVLSSLMRKRPDWLGVYTALHMNGVIIYLPSRDGPCPPHLS